MKITDGERHFELGVLGYEFPRASDHDDANWLDVHIISGDGRDEWSASCACIATFELVDLRDWLLSLPSAENSDVDFIESDLSFGFDAQRGALVVILNFRLHPRVGKYVYADEERFLLEFQWSAINIKKIVDDLDGLIARYPERH